MSSLCEMTATDLRHMIGRKDISPLNLSVVSINRVEMGRLQFERRCHKIMKPHARLQKRQRKVF